MIEVGICMAVISILSLAAMPFIGAQVTEHALRESAGLLQQRINTARTVVLKQRSPATFVFNSHSFTCAYPEYDPDRGTLANRGEEIRLPARVVLQIMPWGESEYSRPEDHEWIIPVGGLSRPTRFKWILGDSYLEADFHPLTGMMREIGFSIR